MDEPNNIQDRNELEENPETIEEQNVSLSDTDISKNENFESGDAGLGEFLNLESVVPMGTDTNNLEVQQDLEFTKDSGIGVSKDTEFVEDSEVGLPVVISENIAISENLVSTLSEGNNTDVSKVDQEILPESTIDLIMNRLSESELVSRELSLHKEYTETEFKETDDRPFDEFVALESLPSEQISLLPQDDVEKASSPSKIVQVFVEDILESVQNIVDGKSTTDEFSTPRASVRSKFEISPSDSTLSDLEAPYVCCTQDESEIVQPPTQVFRSVVTTEPTSAPENLDPDNPLMRRFQNALNAHLQRQKSRIAGELLEMEGDLRQRQKEREDLSTFLYTTQQSLSRQHKTLDKDKGLIMKYFNQRQEVEDLLKSVKTKHKEISNLLQAAQKRQVDFLLEKDNLNTMISQLSEWEASMSSEITRSQLISDKNKADKKLFTQEKLKQDMLLVNLTAEVLRLSTMFTEMEKNIKAKQADLQALTQTVMDGSVDLEALEHENKRLMQVWKVVIFRIQQRDKALIDLKNELTKAQDQFRGLVCQIESYKRLAAGEIKCNENLTGSLSRLEFDLDTLEKHKTLEEDKQRKLREMWVQTDDMIEFTQRDLNSVLAAYAVKDKEIIQLQRDIDKVVSKKYQLEDQILSLLQVQVNNSKIENQSNKLIKQLHQDCREQEVFKSTVENDLTKVMMKIEHESKAIKERQKMLDEEKGLEHDRDIEILSMETEFNHLVRAIGSKQSRVDVINIKVGELLASSAGIELAPEELIINELEKHISTNNTNIQDLQILWMREQSHIVALKQQRTNQLHQLNIYRKQVLIMDHKYLKVDQEIEKYRKDESNMNRGIHLLNQKLASLNEQCSQRRGYKDLLDNDNFVAQNQLICDLKDAEVASLTILEEMCKLEVDKEELRKQLIETQREMLAWEKKEQLAAETKHNMEKAKSESGEIGVMKSEIHRMEVRCAQLHKVQEKLAQDMEMCVNRRDGIVELAYAREKRSVKGAHYNRQQFMRKLDDLRNKIRQVNSEIKSVDKSVAVSEQQLKDLKTRVDVEKLQLKGLEEAVTNMERDLEEGNLHRQKNLELLVRRQRKARLYNEVKTGHYAMVIKNESALELESQKLRTTNADLISVVESLNTDFPILDTPLAQILNTLRSPAA